MYLVWIGAVLVALKWFEVRFITDLSWWWILAPLILAAVYFEVLEPAFGWDKKKAHDENDRFRASRLKKQLRNRPK